MWNWSHYGALISRLWWCLWLDILGSEMLYQNRCGSIHYHMLHSTLTLSRLAASFCVLSGYSQYRRANFKGHIWQYYILQGLLENEYIGTAFAVGEVRTISGVQAVRGSYNISSSPNAKWANLLVLFSMAVGYRILLFTLLRFNVREHVTRCKFCWLRMYTPAAKWIF